MPPNSYRLMTPFHLEALYHHSHVVQCTKLPLLSKLVAPSILRHLTAIDDVLPTWTSQSLYCNSWTADWCCTTIYLFSMNAHAPGQQSVMSDLGIYPAKVWGASCFPSSVAGYCMPAYPTISSWRSVTQLCGVIFEDTLQHPWYRLSLRKQAIRDQFFKT